MGTLANIEDPDEMLHYLLRQNESSGIEKHFNEILTCDPSINIMDHLS